MLFTEMREGDLLMVGGKVGEKSRSNSQRACAQRHCCCECASLLHPLLRLLPLDLTGSFFIYRVGVFGFKGLQG